MTLQSLRPRAWTYIASLVAILGAAMLPSCNATSGGILSSLPVQVGGAARDAGGPLVFNTRFFAPSNCGYSAAGLACGWQVELDQAVVAVGPFYFYTAPPSTQNAQTGTAIVQVTSQVFVNALDPTLYPVDGGASGETGASPSVDVFLLPPGCATGQPGNPNGGDTCSTDLTPLTTYQSLLSVPVTPSNPLEQLQIQSLASGSSAFVAGTATETLDAGGLVIVPFYGFITIDQTTGGNPNDPAAATLVSLQQVAGASPCADGGPAGDAGADCALDFTTQTAALQIRIDPSRWFDGVDFSTLIPAAPTCSTPGCDAGPGWSSDAGPLTWNWIDGRVYADSYFNTEIVEEGLQASNGVYFFNAVAPGDD